MPWAVDIDLDTDKTANGAEVGNIVGTYTDASAFVVPFTFVMRAEFKPSNRPSIKAAFADALTAETTKRSRETTLEAALATVLNS